MTTLTKPLTTPHWYPCFKTYTDTYRVVDDVLIITAGNDVTNAKYAVNGDQLTVTVTNNTGHQLPPGYPEGRRMWINVQFFDGGDVLIGESGAYDSATGVLTHDAEAKIYETELGPADAVASATRVFGGARFPTP